MGTGSRGGGGENGHAACPFCTIQIPEEATVCPHCHNVLSPRGGRGNATRRPPLPRGASASDYWERYGVWVKAAGPVLLALAVLLLAYQKWVRVTVTVVPNRLLSVQAGKEKRGKTVVIRGTVTNQGEDVPDLSLRSIGVVVEFAYRNGSRDRKTVFPKSEYRGEGALLRGETGRFEIEAPADGLEQVVLRSEVVDLGLGQQLIRPRGRPPVNAR